MSVHRDHYECRRCAETVHPYTYRASCPECGGPLAASPGG